MKNRLPRIDRADARHLPATQSPILNLLPFLLIVVLMCVSVAAKEKRDPRDPYATAEYETAPAVNAEDLAYRTILFEDFIVPAEWEAKARKLVTATEEQAISRLSSTHAFTTVAKKQDPLPEDPSFVVQCKLLNYRMVSKKSRFFAGAIAGTSYITYQVQVHDGKSSTLLFQREISTENNAFAAAWSFNDKNLPTFLGNVLGDYLALRARKDKGVNVLPLENVAQASTETPAK
jgi:Domain of unknown function (DUF4410)